MQASVQIYDIFDFVPSRTMIVGGQMLLLTEAVPSFFISKNKLFFPYHPLFSENCTSPDNRHPSSDASVCH